LPHPLSGSRVPNRQPTRQSDPGRPSEGQDPVNPLVRVQIENNVTTARAWGSFAAHRKRVTGLLQARSAASRLCVLGAGNCNDLDVRELLASHAEIHLVDLDADALSRGIARQNVDAHRSIHTHAPFDLSGRLEAIASWRPSAPVAD